MIIKKFDLKHVGVYICKASNEFGEDLKEVKVGIKLAPVVTMSSEKLILREGEKGSLRCDITGVDGESTIKWTFNQKPVTTSVSMITE